MGIPRAKAAIRQQILQARTFRRTSEGEALADQLCSLAEVRCSRAIAAYASTTDEPDTWPFIERWAGDLWLPVVVGESLHWGRHTEPRALVPKDWGLLEPKVEMTHLPEAVSVIVIPALACDPVGHRLGRGAGFYDRALAAPSERSVTVIAAVYDEEVLPVIPHEPFDVPVDIIVTPLRVIHVAQASRRSNNT